MFTVIEGVAEPLLQIPPLFPKSITLSFAQIVVAPFAEIIYTSGSGLTVTNM